MNFFERRRWKKIVAQLLHDARHVENMKGDIAEPSDIEELRAATDVLRAAGKERDEEKLKSASERVNQAIAAIYPAVRFPRLRENVEVIVVALSVAMAFRTYFIQPFKIPTGSMQPTLYGITVKEQKGAGWMDRFPLNLVSMVLFGERYVEVRAQASGVLQVPREELQKHGDTITFYVAGVPHELRVGMPIYFDPQKPVQKGQLLASGRIVYGDHIFVNKVRYNFSKPELGDIIVFSTDGIDYPQIKPHSFYIKRLAGVPGDVVSINPPYLEIDGEKVTSPYPFERMVSDTNAGYAGYTLAKDNPLAPVYLRTRSQTRTVGETRYLPLGDNSAHSLDGRYFGPVDRENLVGPAFMVYWPLSRRWGFVQ